MYYGYLFGIDRNVWWQVKVIATSLLVGRLLGRYWSGLRGDG